MGARTSSNKHMKITQDLIRRVYREGSKYRTQGSDILITFLDPVYPPSLCWCSTIYFKRYFPDFADLIAGKKLIREPILFIYPVGQYFHFNPKND